MCILLIDTCTERGILAYGSSTEILFVKELPFGPIQSKFLMPYLNEALQSWGCPPDLDVIGVSIGPGSYTGIRLGVAVAQALSYSWKVPLVGVSSLEGFVPSISDVHYAAVLDARIGGIYFQKGWSNVDGILYQTDPQVSPIEEIEHHLKEVTYLVTPFAKPLRLKLKQYETDQQWVWEERAPSAQALLRQIEQSYRLGKTVFPPCHLELLYLRQTEAEREKAKKE